MIKKIVAIWLCGLFISISTYARGIPSGLSVQLMERSSKIFRIFVPESPQARVPAKDLTSEDLMRSGWRPFDKNAPGYSPYLEKSLRALTDIVDEEWEKTINNIALVIGQRELSTEVRCAIIMALCKTKFTTEQIQFLKLAVEIVPFSASDFEIFTKEIPRSPLLIDAAGFFVSPDLDPREATYLMIELKILNNDYKGTTLIRDFVDLIKGFYKPATMPGHVKFKLLSIAFESRYNRDEKRAYTAPELLASIAGLINRIGDVPPPNPTVPPFSKTDQAQEAYYQQWFSLQTNPTQ